MGVIAFTVCAMKTAGFLLQYGLATFLPVKRMSAFVPSSPDSPLPSNLSNNMKNLSLYKKIESIKPRSAWKRGVKSYALELVESAEVELTPENVKATLLNGAKDWREYSYGGCSSIYDYDIAERLCTPSELKKKKGGELQPNTRETWLDVQARALFQAFNLINRLLK